MVRTQIRVIFTFDISVSCNETIVECLWEFLKRDFLFVSLGDFGAQKSPTEAALEDMTLEELELDEELGNVNQKLDLYKSQESQCKKTLVENIEKQEILFASNKGELQAREVDAPLIWDMGDITREMNLIELMSEKQDLRAEMDGIRKKLRGLEREAQALENEKNKLADFISELEYRVINKVKSSQNTLTSWSILVSGF